MRLAALLLFLPLFGCGYQFVAGQLPGGVRQLYLPLALNSTTEPLLENVLAGSLTAVLARQQGVDLVETESRADAVLTTAINRYSVEPLSYDSNDRISEFRATMSAHFVLTKSSDGRRLWQADIQRHENYSAALDKNRQEDLESVAIDLIAKNIADDLVYRLVTRF